MRSHTMDLWYTLPSMRDKTKAFKSDGSNLKAYGGRIGICSCHLQNISAFIFCMFCKCLRSAAKNATPLPFLNALVQIPYDYVQC